LENLGYRTVAFSSGVSLSEIHDADIYLSRYSEHLNDLETVLLSTSVVQVPIDLFQLDTPLNGYHADRERVLYTFEHLAQVSSIDGPKLVFAHIVAPHPPFVFDRNGQPVQPDRSYFLGDAEDYRGDAQEYVRGYAEQLTFVNQRVLDTVDAILANSTTPPVIILQGDHGPGAFFDWNLTSDSCLWERFSILNAYYLPQGGAARLYETITPVNSFRVVFDIYFGTELGLLEDRKYFSSWDLPYDTTNVSDSTQIPCSVP
jgi:hypothetical protein